ncbi:hypothetical protein fugu_013983 [Takifugu bimaculatus]|uniref:Voltage-gated potassium channel subunit beta-1 n=1 Tax=Takifugu bimaculatus TaxID=433685 RepID=A0A4Z2C0U6_9TELE|nr:hypothetical protein fugu_013983 [Takifugu bimaculatus]
MKEIAAGLSAPFPISSKICFNVLLCIADLSSLQQQMIISITDSQMLLPFASANISGIITDRRGKHKVLAHRAVRALICRAETERGLNRKHIIEGLKGSLQRMQLEYVDVVFANRPDSNTPMEEIVRAMTHVINQGMSMYWGTSRWSAMEIMEAYSVARQFNLIPPVCEQAEYHFFQRDKVETQLPELYHKIGVGVVSWSPLACGIITGKYENGVPESSRASMKPYQWLREKIMSEDGRKQQAKLKELAHIAEKLGCTLPQLAIAWCLRNEGVSSVLLGSSSPSQLTENLGAIQVIPKMTAGIASEVDHILENCPHSKKDYHH